MNRYGRLLMTQWWGEDRQRYQAIPEPEAFFTSLGEEVESAIQRLADELARTAPPRSDYLAEVGRLTMLRLEAEELVLADLAIASPASGWAAR
jgi:hypothetical protein